MKNGKINVGPCTVEITHADKVLFPEDNITKGDLIEYYYRIAEVMLPHMKDRPINMNRFPDGINGQSFFQQQVSDYFPDWIERVSVPKKDGGITVHPLCNNSATLVYMANLACITPHIWLSRADKLSHPDKLILDLDPSDGFEQARTAALNIKDLTDEIGLPALVMTTGSRGLHVVIPLNRSEDFDSVRSVAKNMADILALRHPGRITLEQHKQSREGKLFLDTLRNSYGQTTVAPYAIRARKGAPVATPLEWSEIEDRRIHSQYFNIGNIFRRLKHKLDPWKNILDMGISLKEAGGSFRDILKELKY